MKSYFYKKVKEELNLKFQKEKNYHSIMEVPRLKKIMISMSVKKAIQDKKALTDAFNELTSITGQKPVITKAKKSVSSFKLRKGMGIGYKVTLRGDKMYSFFYRLISIIIPRIRDFNGLKKNSFDKQGNYNLGIKEEIIFPEIDYDKVKDNKGMNITIVTNCQDVQKSLIYLKFIGLPINLGDKN